MGKIYVQKAINFCYKHQLSIILQEKLLSSLVHHQNQKTSVPAVSKLLYAGCCVCCSRQLCIYLGKNLIILYKLELKTVWLMKELLIMSNLVFCNTVFKSHLFHMHPNQLTLLIIMRNFSFFRNVFNSFPYLHFHFALIFEVSTFGMIVPFITNRPMAERQLTLSHIQQICSRLLL